MTTASQPGLRTLLQLLHGELSPPQSIAVREQLAMDLVSARRFAQLVAVTRNTTTSVDALAHFADVTIDEVAAYVDGSLPANDEARFEEQCWANESLLREVFASWNPEKPGAVNAAAGSADTVPTEDRMQRIALSSINALDGSTEPVEVTLKAPDPGMSAKGRPVTSSQPASRLTVAVMITTAVLALIAVIGFAIREQPAAFNEITKDREPDKLPSPDPDTNAIVQIPPDRTKDGVESKGPDRRPLPNELTLPGPGTSGQKMVDVPETNPGKSATEIPKSPPGTDPESQQRVRLPIASLVESWKDDAGIVVLHSPSTGVWCGIRSSAADAIRTTSSAATVMTLQNSRAEVRLQGTGQMVLDQESSVAVRAPRRVVGLPADPAKPNVPDSQETNGEILLYFGRVVFNQLVAGKTFTVRVDDVTYSIEVVDEHTSVGVDYSGEFLTFAVFRGEAVVDDHRLSRRVWARADSVRGLNEFRDIPDAEEWTAARITPNNALRDLTDAVNKSDSAALAVADFRDNDHPMVMFQGTQVLLQCSGSLDRRVPDEVIRSVALSPLEPVRNSLVNWMLMELRHDRGRDQQLADSLLKPIGFPIDQQETLKGWFLAATAGARPTQQHLTELQTALQARRPVFGRQCAKYFLQIILNDPLSEYDPAAPTDRTALNGITRKLRAWQQLNLP